MNRGYGWAGGSTRAWRRARAAKLERTPTCEDCERRGVTEVAVEVHHIEHLSKGGHRLHLDNLRSLCSTCHAAAHVPSIIGCDVDGNPLDPKSHWYRK